MTRRLFRVAASVGDFTTGIGLFGVTVLAVCQLAGWGWL